MLKLHIRFESSWTNSFFKVGEDGNRDEPLFTSGSQLAASAKGIEPADLDLTNLAASNSRLEYLQALQTLNPNLLYRVPESFHRTVQGILARLTGEVRRLKDVEGDHLALRAFAAGTYEVKIEHEHSQLVKLNTYCVNDIQSGGAGVIAADALYSGSADATYLLSALGNSLAAIESALSTGLPIPVTGWVPASPSELIDRLATLNAEQTDVVKKAQKLKDAAHITAYPCIFDFLAKKLPEDVLATLKIQSERALDGNIQAKTTVADGALYGWSLAGAFIVVQVKSLSIDERERYIAEGLLTRNGGFAGLAMTGSVGSVTPKDMFTFASGQKAKSSSLPYSIDIPVATTNSKKTFIQSGILKKTGTLSFEISGNLTLEDELRTAIENASVGPFHFGKKGVAYVLSLH